MTATELYEALQGVPEKCLCGTIRFNPDGDIDSQWCDDIGSLVQEVHAAALQRDAMVEWLATTEMPSPDWVPGVLFLHNDERTWLACEGREDGSYETIGVYPTRLHALAAVCRYVSDNQPRSGA